MRTLRVLRSSCLRSQSAPRIAPGQLIVDFRNRRTALAALPGELDLVTVSKVAELLERRGLTFMDLRGVRELLKRNEDARSNRHNVACCRFDKPKRSPDGRRNDPVPRRGVRARRLRRAGRAREGQPV